jgi:hypothetical protein
MSYWKRNSRVILTRLSLASWIQREKGTSVYSRVLLATLLSPVLNSYYPLSRRKRRGIKRREERKRRKGKGEEKKKKKTKKERKHSVV